MLFRSRESENRASATQAQQDAEARSRFATGLSSAQGNALTQGQSIFGGFGQETSDRFTPELERLINATNVPDLANNIGSFFDPNLANTILDRGRTSDIRGFNNQLNQFAPVGFTDTSIQNTADDSIISGILANRREAANEFGDRAVARGSFNSAGRSAFDQSLDEQSLAGNAQLQALGGGVLGNERDTLRGLANQFRGNVNSFDFGQAAPDIAGFQNTLGNRQTSLAGEREGNILNALGGQDIFDTSKAFLQGGAGQGATNNIGALASAFGGAADRRSNTTGLKDKQLTSGVF